MYYCHRAVADFVIEAPLVSLYVVLRTLKQRRLEESAASRSRRRGHPTKEEQQAEQEAEVRDNPPRAVPLTDPAFVQRLREWFATPPSANGYGISGAKTQPAAG